MTLDSNVKNFQDITAIDLLFPKMNCKSYYIEPL